MAHKSAYEKLAEQYQNRVKFGNPVPNGKRPANVGLYEITSEVDGMTEKMQEMSSTSAMRCEALKRWLDNGKTVYIKTATGMGRARFWSTL